MPPTPPLLPIPTGIGLGTAPLDLNVADITAIGTAAAGATGLAADAGHTHPQTSNAGNPGGDVTLSTTVYTTVATTTALAVGTWQLDAAATISNGNATAGTCELTVIAGTATATFTGVQSAQGMLPALSGGSIQLSIGAIVTVTVAGTLLIQAKAPGVSASTAKLTTPTSGSSKATGYLATRTG